MKIRILVIEAAIILLVCGCANQTGRRESADISPGTFEQTSQRYINPLSIEESTSLADPTVLRFKGTYYLFLTGGMVWSSDDLVHWKHHKVSMPEGIFVVAPSAFEYEGQIFLTGNDIGLLRSQDPIGPWEYIGDFKDAKGKTIKLFDPMVFVDDDGRVYVYYAGKSIAGIYGVELDSGELTRFKGVPAHFFKFEPSHIWERFGASNEYSKVSWIEGPWMTRRKGTYYLQYSAVGTDWPSYAVGYYTSKKPLGPFTYYRGSPILVQKKGLINGTGHHCIIEAPDGSLWAFYNILYRNWNRLRGTERRIGMDAAGFDKDGNLFINGPTETPQPAPGNKVETGDSIPLSIDSSYWVSSEGPGRNAPYGFDNNVRTWWEPNETDTQPWITLDLGAASEFDPKQEFIVNSSRILFSAGRIRNSTGIVASPFRYKIEVSADNKMFKTVVDKTKNDIFATVEFDEIEPIKSRYVKLTVTERPKENPVGIIEFTVFGKPAD